MSLAPARETMAPRPSCAFGTRLRVRQTPRLLKNLKAELEFIHSVFFRESNDPQMDDMRVTGQ